MRAGGCVSERRTLLTIRPMRSLLLRLPLVISDVDKAVAAAKAAFPIWSAKPTAERARILREISENIIKHQPELAKWDVLDHGSLVSFANMFTFVAGKHFEAAAELAKQVMDVGEINIMPGLIPYLKREPIGVVAAIVPWNIPMMIAAKIAYALATGNTVVQTSVS